MNNAIVFEGRDEVLVVSAAKVNAFVKLYFLEGKRSLDDYDIYLNDIDRGFVVSVTPSFEDDHMQDFDVTELMPNQLRQDLIDAELLTDES